MHFNASDLLNSNQFFHSVEPPVSDQNYVIAFLLVANSITDLSDISGALPKHFTSHAKFFESAYSQYLPSGIFSQIINTDAHDIFQSKSVNNSNYESSKDGSHALPQNFVQCFKLIKDLTKNDKFTE